MQTRKEARFGVQRPVSFHGDHLSGDGTILNISRQGCAITSETVVEAEAYLQLRLELREQEHPIQVDVAAVRWSTRGKFGVEFIKMPSEAGERLKHFVALLESGA